MALHPPCWISMHDYARNQWIPILDYARKCVRYNIPSTVNNIPINIIEKVYAHSIQGFSKYDKLNYYNHTKKIVQSMTATYVLDC